MLKVARFQVNMQLKQTRWEVVNKSCFFCPRAGSERYEGLF